MVARIVAEQLRDRLGITVVVENRPGAAGTIAAEHVARARPDGATLLLASASTHGINPTLMPKQPFDAQRDFTPVSLVTMVPSILAVNAALPVTTRFQSGSATCRYSSRRPTNSSTFNARSVGRSGTSWTSPIGSMGSP